MPKLTVARMRDLEKQVIAGEISYSRMIELINEEFGYFKQNVEITLGPVTITEAKEPSVSLITVDLPALKNFVITFWHEWYYHKTSLAAMECYDEWLKSKEAQELLSKFHHPEPLGKITALHLTNGKIFRVIERKNTCDDELEHNYVPGGNYNFICTKCRNEI